MPRSFEEKYYLTDPTLCQRIKRDAGLFLDSLAFFITWLTLGRQIRRAYRRAQQENTEVILEDLLEKKQ